MHALTGARIAAAEDVNVAACVDRAVHAELHQLITEQTAEKNYCKLHNWFHCFEMVILDI